MAMTSADTKVITGKVRTSFVHIFTPDAMPGQEPKYSLRLIIPKEDKETIAKIRTAITNAAKAGVAKVGDKQGQIPKNLAHPLRDADAEGLTEEYPELENCYFLNASSKTKPGVVHRNPKIEITGEENPAIIYSGCYVRASINFYAYNTNGNKGIAAGLNNVQFWGDGDYLGGRASAQAEFDEIDDAPDSLPVDEDDPMFD